MTETQSEQVTLSALIRKGAQMVPQQARSSWVDVAFDPYSDDELIAGFAAACALGAACIAVNPSPLAYRQLDDEATFIEYQLYRALGYYVTEEEVRWPAAVHETDEDDLPTISQVVIALNDEAGWTFEQIAAWLEAQGW